MMTMTTYDANEVSQHRHPSTAFHSKTTSLPPVAGRGVRNIYDAGSNVFIGPHVPHVLQETKTTPVHEKVQVADNSFSKITGITTIGGAEFCIAAAFSDVLVPQSFVEKQDCSTVLANRSLYIINKCGTKTLNSLIANSQFLACPKIDAAPTGLYELSTDTMQSIINAGSAFSNKLRSKIQRNIKTPHISNGITRYHTVTF